VKDFSLRQRWVVNVDQRRSRREPDRVPAALTALEQIPGVLLGFERTAGDEIQGLLAEAAGVVAVVVALARFDVLEGSAGPGWRIGIGLGEVEDEAVGSTREARGPAYLAAREAVERAGRAPGGLVLLAADPERAEAAVRAETALVLLRGVLAQRSAKGWEVVDLLDGTDVQRAEKQSDVAAKLGISESAVSQRLDRAGWQEGIRAAELARHLLVQAQKGPG
jgi:hypothetical protein